MGPTTRKTVSLGDLVVTTFDKAAQLTTDAREASLLATSAVRHMLRKARRQARLHGWPERRAEAGMEPDGMLSLWLAIESRP